jgi:hypothetical protein
VTPRRAPNPKGVPAAYIMKPYVIHLSYNGTSIAKVVFELAVDEIDSLDQAVEMMDDSLIKLFVDIGLEEPRPVSVLSVEHQLAQKLHACTALNAHDTNDRAHDLVDIQFLFEDGEFDLMELDRVGRRLFPFRQMDEWPPTVREFPGWLSLYEDAADGLGVRQLDATIMWANALIASAVASDRT